MIVSVTILIKVGVDDVPGFSSEGGGVCVVSELSELMSIGGRFLKGLNLDLTDLKGLLLGIALSSSSSTITPNGLVTFLGLVSPSVLTRFSGLN